MIWIDLTWYVSICAQRHFNCHFPSWIFQETFADCSAGIFLMFCMSHFSHHMHSGLMTILMWTWFGWPQSWGVIGANVYLIGCSSWYQSRESLIGSNPFFVHLHAPDGRNFASFMSAFQQRYPLWMHMCVFNSFFESINIFCCIILFLAPELKG